MKRNYLKPAFIETDNVRNFAATMSALDRNAGEGRLACVHGRAGRGKTRTAQAWHATTGAAVGSVYLRSSVVWTPKAFLAALARELGHKNVPWSTAAAYVFVCDLLTAARPVFIDEIERLPRVFLELTRDLTDSTGAPFVLIGEEELPDWMRRERRVWSRTIEQLSFKPLDAPDICYYAATAAGVDLEAEAVDQLLEASGGDFRIVKRALGAALLISAGKAPTKKQMKTAIEAGVKGK